MTCATCMYFVGKKEEDKSPGHGDKRNILNGWCHCHPPTMSGFPTVFETEWCGEHKIDIEGGD